MAVPVAPDELGGRVHHNVGAMLNRSKEIGSGKGVVNDQRNLVSVGDIGQCIDVVDVTVGVAQSFDKNGLGIVLNGPLHSIQVMGIDKSSGNAVFRKGVGQQIIAAAIDSGLRDDMFSGPRQVLKSIADRCGP